MFVVDPGNNHVYLDGVLICTICYYQEMMLNYSCLCWLIWNKVPKMRELIAGLRDNHFKTHDNHFKTLNMD